MGLDRTINVEEGTREIGSEETSSDGSIAILKDH